MKNTPGSWERWGILLAASGLLILPLLSLLPFGILWLWQQGFFLLWLGMATAVSILFYSWGWLLQKRLRKRLALKPTDANEEVQISAPGSDWSDLDLAAWKSVQQLAYEVDPKILSDQHLLLETAQQTITQVAQHYYPDAPHAIWGFTVPEALLLVERISTRLRRVILEHVPGSHLIRMNQVMQLWAYQPTMKTGLRFAGHLGRVYKTVRWINPASAALAAAREKLISAMLGEAGDYLRQRGARIWVEEVGRAAIELYSGRLRLDLAELQNEAGLSAAGPGVELASTGSVRVVVAGSGNTGKSSLVNALLDTHAAGVDALPLTEAQSGYTFKQEGATDLVVIDTPGLSTKAQLTTLVDSLLACDCILWVVSAHRADRALDQAALSLLHEKIAAQPTRMMPPIVIILTHVDRLSPAREWSPPYDVNTPTTPKATTMRSAMEAVAKDLGQPLEKIVPTRVDTLKTAWNVDVVWAVLLEQLERAHRVRARRIATAAAAGNWRQILQQAKRAGSKVTTELIRRESKPKA